MELPLRPGRFLVPGTGRSRSRQWPHQAFHIGMQGVQSLQNHPSAPARMAWKWISDVRDARQGLALYGGGRECIYIWRDERVYLHITYHWNFMPEVKPLLFCMFLLSLFQKCDLFTKFFFDGLDGCFARWQWWGRPWTWSISILARPPCNGPSPWRRWLPLDFNPSKPLWV